MGNINRLVPIHLAAAIVVLYLLHVISGTTAIILLVIAVIFVATSFASFGPQVLAITPKIC